MTWDRGRERIETLLSGGQLRRVPADLNSARALIDTARRHLESCEMIQETDPQGAFAAAYDAARKACSALLEVQGLRATTRGGHIPIRDAIEAQFTGLTGAESLRSLDRLRRRRNEIEYPGGDYVVETEEMEQALARVAAIIDFASKLVDRLPVF